VSKVASEEAISAVAQRLFVGVMCPLVLGGQLLPGHAIGEQTARWLGQHPALLSTAPDHAEAVLRVYGARLSRARLLAPIDRLELQGSGAEWTLAAALHDVLQSANPAFDSPLRRTAATRVLALASATLAGVPAPATVRDALSRHSWFARVLDIARTDTSVSWWLGTRTFLGVEAPARLRAWPELRRVRVAASRRAVLDLAPIAFDRDLLVEALSRLLSKTPLTDLATCTRPAPAFAWSESTLALVATRAGRTLALRALARLPAGDVDSALGRATRQLFVQKRAAVSGPALAVLAERALSDAQLHAQASRAARQPARQPPSPSDAAFARAIGAAVAREQLESVHAWSGRERRELLPPLERALRSEAAREALAVMAAMPRAGDRVPA
jgi:hypothetical protein